MGITGFVFTFWAAEWIKEFGASRTEVNVAFMLFTLAQGAVSPFLGRVLDRHQIRSLIVTGAGLLAGGFLLVSIATAMWQITVIYSSILAVACVLSGPLAAQTLTAKWFRARRGLAIGWGSTGGSIGGVILPALATYLILQLGWRQAHQVLAALAFVIVAPLVWRYVANRPEDLGLEPEPEGRFDLVKPGQAATWTIAQAMRSRNFWIPIAAFLPLMAAMGTVQANLRLYSADSGIDAASTAFMMSVFAGTTIAGKLLFGFLADRVDQRLLYWAATSILALCLLLLIGKAGFALLVLICAMLGIAAGGFLPLLGAIIGARFGAASYGQVLGTMGFFLTFSAVAPPIGGWIRDSTGSYDGIFQGLLLVLVPAMISMAFLTQPREPAVAVPAAG
jgi:MFS family permease